LLAADVVAERLLATRGELAVRRPEPAADLLAELAAPADRTAWWRSRLAAAYETMTA
jgi:O-succinylbenzoate synthase